jgi:hypothetical protein
MTHFLAFVIGTTSGIAAAVVTSLLSFRTTVWEQRRHDYGQLLIVLANRDPEEIVRRLELVALMGTKPIAEKALAIKSEIESKGAAALDGS